MFLKYGTDLGSTASDLDYLRQAGICPVRLGSGTHELSAASLQLPGPSVVMSSPATLEGEDCSLFFACSLPGGNDAPAIALCACLLRLGVSDFCLE